MKALILNSGIGARMSSLTAEQPKCMTQLGSKETIISRQLRQLAAVGIDEVVITTGAFDKALMTYCQSLELSLEYTFVNNPVYKDTNYIYSICCAKEYLDDDIIMLHGDLVFEDKVLAKVMAYQGSCMVTSSTAPLPEKDFKAVIKAGQIEAIGVELFEAAIAAQPLYKLTKDTFIIWLDKMMEYCQRGNTKCYAEDAFNEVSSQCLVNPLDIKNMFCHEVDTPNDLEVVSKRLAEGATATVYMCFASDILHSGHISIISKAKQLGKLTIGILTDEAVATYKHFPLVPYDERKIMFENIVGVNEVVKQTTLSYKENLEKYRPDYVVHGDDWRSGVQKPVRDEVITILNQYGGKLVEFPYSTDKKYQELANHARATLSLPDIRRTRLKKLIEMKGLVTAIEAHSGITGLIAEQTVIYSKGEAHQFDAMWISSLCDSTSKGKPDIELVDVSSRFKTIDDIMEVTTKPIIFDGDTGGLAEHFVYTVKTLERIGVSMVIIEDKVGLKKNSLFGNAVSQTQDSIANFQAKIRAGKRAQKSKDFMICARIESLILEQGLEDALLRALAFVDAGADAIMIHSKRKEPDEIFEFIKSFRAENKKTPVVVVPTSFNMVTEEEFKKRGVNVVIYANQLMRTGFPAMQKAAQTILEHHRAKECDDMCMPIEEIINLIPEDTL